jgi:chlorobactene glucosyltransferase
MTSGLSLDPTASTALSRWRGSATFLARERHRPTMTSEIFAFSSALWLVYLSWREARSLVRLRQSFSDGSNTLPARAPAVTDAGLVSIVIPARNEETNIVDCLTMALAQDYPNLEVVVLEDGSTDQTADALRQITHPKLRVIAGGQGVLPAGWLGKTWACERAASAARGDWLLFIDADVRIAPDAVSKAVGFAHEHQLGLLTGFGTELAATLAERILQPYIFFLSAADTNWAAVNSPHDRSKARGNGRFLLFHRQEYERIGRHESVRRFVAEDEAIARRAKRLGVRCRFLFFPGVYQCRMYRSGRELWAGWRKLVFQGLSGLSDELPPASPGLLAVRLSVRLIQLALVSVLPYVVVALGLAGVAPFWMAVLGAIPVGIRQASRFSFDRQAGFDAVTGVVTQGLGNIAFMLLMMDAFRAGILGKNSWKGRVLPR